ncbi:MAG TPA: hypothetical protein VHR45_09700 [Thermoanaerobaculia bacterium]|nr:hypothetical protein [Thermoanaerobaculia bacterium]
MTDFRTEYKTAQMEGEQLAHFLALEPEDSRRRAAEAELRLREHRAILAQADSAERGACAAERQAAAAERTAKATRVYVALTFCILICTVIVTAWRLGAP